MSYVVNTNYILRTTIKDTSGTPINPATVSIFVLPPGGTVAEIVMVNESLGVYTGSWEPTVRGDWWLTLKTVNPDIHGVDGKVTVLGSFRP